MREVEMEMKKMVFVDIELVGYEIDEEVRVVELMIDDGEDRE